MFQKRNLLVNIIYVWPVFTSLHVCDIYPHKKQNMLIRQRVINDLVRQKYITIQNTNIKTISLNGWFGKIRVFCIIIDTRLFYYIQGYIDVGSSSWGKLCATFWFFNVRYHPRLRIYYLLIIIHIVTCFTESAQLLNKHEDTVFTLFK